MSCTKLMECVQTVKPFVLVELKTKGMQALSYAMITECLCVGTVASKMLCSPFIMSRFMLHARWGILQMGGTAWHAF